MSEEKLANLLASMRGARFDEFTVRAVSLRLSFSKDVEGRQVAFLVETNGDICSTEEKCPSDAAMVATLLSPALELRLEGIGKLPSNAYKFDFERGVTFRLADSERLWDNVFSVRTVDWPERGSHEAYFFL
jgi:hypothetical protein